ncbi:F-box/LRR-repeat protein 7-like [Rhincodon typus]|uniref:F-box/LRR-repeat protein 7-like n=1 Tax=Rhincodon typus TaxID=259920 RepID=UPI00202F28AE|nr:F-box/LRR-repeat protein 7-like [Rhincodon typus]
MELEKHSRSNSIQGARKSMFRPKPFIRIRKLLQGKGSSSISSDMSSSTDHTPTKARRNAATSEGSASLPVSVEKRPAAEEPPSWTSEDKHTETSEEARLPPASPTSPILTPQ